MTYNISIVWMSVKTYPVEANSLQEAVDKAKEEFFDDPDDNYIEDSYEVYKIIKDEYPNEPYNDD